MPARTGAEYLEGLSKRRPKVYLGGERVSDIAGHPAFAGAAHEIAAIFDWQHENADVCLYPDPETGELINRSHMIVRTKEELALQRQSLQRVSELSMGILGRTPDYKNVTYAAFAGLAPVEWAADGNEEGAERLIAYQKYIRRNDVLLTHCIVQPTVDKSAGDFPTNAMDVPLQKVGETEHGVILSGARIFATLAPFADEIAVFPGLPIPADADRFAYSFCIPVETPGLRLLCRDSYSAPRQARFDYPLSSRMDEQDAFVIFDRVEVPWDRLFINGDVAAYNRVSSPAVLGTFSRQALIRAQTKLAFAWGLGNAMAEVIGDKSPATQILLGEIWGYAELTRTALDASDAEATVSKTGMVVAGASPLWALQTQMPFWMPRVAEILKLIGSHNLLCAPSEAMFNNEELRPLIDKYLRGPEGVDAERRAQVARLAWDFCGTALAGRSDLYERFYLGSGTRARQSIQRRTANGPSRERADRLVARILGEPQTR